ncbi:MAG: hypothetical protein ACXVY5_09465 [Gaiellales bacterium]
MGHQPAAGQPKTGREESRMLWSNLVQQIAIHVQRIGARCGNGHTDARTVRPVYEEEAPEPPPLPNQPHPPASTGSPSRAHHWWPVDEHEGNGVA